ncbi:MAG: polymerase subunit gamma/tau, partial [Herbaspirillum sp.]|nr:polymerase subunit gamma/tau [Herbaspirillum sp.]
PSAQPARPPAAAPARSAAPAPAPAMDPQSSSAPPPWEQEAPPWERGDAEPSTAESRTEARPAARQTPVSAPAPAAIAAAAPPAAAEPQTFAPADPEAEKNILRIAADLNWDGGWPALAIALPLRGVAHQLARHSQLCRCDDSVGNALTFGFRIPYENLCAAGSVDKLGAALTERFGKPVRIEVEVGAVQLTADILAQAEQAARQRDAEQRVNADPFLQTLMREFGATVAQESIRPA